MTKLEGNERWKTKMITPEFADTYEAAHIAAPGDDAGQDH
ncbi:hypothetical protein SAMN03159358_2197 [Paenibacillus sp. NFR01]|nr:hypothetical protein SAMN03159358_2197 [Paenibacillus sp. NFR01]